LTAPQRRAAGVTRRGQLCRGPDAPATHLMRSLTRPRLRAYKAALQGGLINAASPDSLPKVGVSGRPREGLRARTQGTNTPRRAAWGSHGPGLSNPRLPKWPPATGGAGQPPPATIRELRAAGAECLPALPRASQSAVSALPFPGTRSPCRGPVGRGALQRRSSAISNGGLLNRGRRAG
jgi:hypothetical protein